MDFEVKFTGKTKKEATQFISTYIPYIKDINRLDRGYPPYYTNYPVQLSNGEYYQPSHFVLIKNYIHDTWDTMDVSRRMLDHSWGDGWSEEYYT